MGKTKKICPHCGRPALVGWGVEGKIEWMCLDLFNERLRIKDDALRKGLGPYEWHRLPR